MNEVNRLQVVSGLITRTHSGVIQILLAQRPVNKEFPYLWETPGGRVESGETGQEAVEREVLEELGVRANVRTSTIAFATYDPPHVRTGCTLYMFRGYVSAAAVDPKPLEGQHRVGWYTLADVTGMRFTSFSEHCRSLIEAALRGEQ